MPSIVRTPLECHLWSQAQTNNEWASTRFWEHKIRGEFPGEDDWVVASQQPPTDDPGDRRRVELVVDKWTGKITSRLFIFEAKKHNASQTEIDALEYQAYEACITHLKYTQREQMYAQTVIGTLARQWVAHIDEDYLVPWVPMGASLGDKSSYIEAHGSDGHLIENGWAYMKKHLEISRKDLNRLRESLRSVVESTQPSASYNAANPGLGYSSSYPYAGSSTAPASGMSSSYTVPLVQHSSTHEASGSATSYAGYSAANPESRSSYTVPLVQHSSTNEVSSSATSYAGYSAANPGSRSSYTVPLVQHSSTHEASISTASYAGYSAANPEPGSGSGDTHPANSSTEPDPGRISSPSGGVSPRHEAQGHYLLVPKDAKYVEVEVEAKKDGNIYHFSYDGQHYRKEDSDWADRGVEYEGRIHACVLCTGNSTGKSFWTWSLRDLEPYTRGKEKKRRR